MNIQIKNFFEKVLFEYDKENNTLKDTVVKAIKSGVSLKCAKLYGADLSDTDLSGADLSYANLSGANLRNVNLKDAKLGFVNFYNADLNSACLRNAKLAYAKLSGANLKNAYLKNANLYDVDLSYVNFINANLENADLRKSNFYSTNLYHANLHNANIYNVDLSYAKNIPYIPLVCPPKGSFIAWKKIRCYKENYKGVFIVKLLIPKNAKRSSATSNKCRCDKAKVLEIRNIYNNSTVEIITNRNFIPCVYKVGEFVYSDSFDSNRWNECSNGIHFFMEEKDAINY